MDKIIGFIVAAVGAVLIFVLISLLLIKIGWSLFMVPVFGLAELSWMQALGFSLLAACFRSTTSRSS